MTFAAWVILVSITHFGAYCLAAWLIGRHNTRATTRRTIDRRIVAGYQPGRWWRP